MSAPGPTPRWHSGLAVASQLAAGTLLALLLPGLARAEGVAPPEPIVVRTVAPSTTPDPRLEEALRLALFPVRVDDGHGHGPDPGSEEWKQARRTLIGRQCAQAGSLRYAWSRVDLNGDGSPEVVATVVGPFVCGTGGCPLLIFQERKGSLVPITTMSLFKEPLIVSERRSNGWKNLISRVRLDAARSTYAVLAFDGRSYPTNPSVPPAQPLQKQEPGTAYLSWDPSGKALHPLPCQAVREMALLGDVQ
jgi:hypothetical protein